MCRVCSYRLRACTLQPVGYGFVPKPVPYTPRTCTLHFLFGVDVPPYIRKYGSVGVLYKNIVVLRFIRKHVCCTFYTNICLFLHVIRKYVSLDVLYKNMFVCCVVYGNMFFWTIHTKIPHNLSAAVPYNL